MKNANRPMDCPPCQRHFWHAGFEAAFGAKSKREQVTADVR